MASIRPRPGIGSPAYTSKTPCRPSIRALPLPTSRNTQPSTVGSLATSGFGAGSGTGGAEAVAVWIDPVDSFGAAGAAAAAATGAAAGATTEAVLRSFSTVSL